MLLNHRYASDAAAASSGEPAPGVWDLLRRDGRIQKYGTIGTFPLFYPPIAFYHSFITKDHKKKANEMYVFINTMNEQLHMRIKSK